MASDNAPTCCAPLHVDRSDVRAVVTAEKGRGLWRSVTVDEAVSATAAARFYPCICECHR